MRETHLPKLLALSSLVVFLFYACTDDSYLASHPPVPDQSFVEEFDSASAALDRGWQFVNASNPRGGGVWQNGGDLYPWFNPYSNHGSFAGFIGAGISSTAPSNEGTISNWLISPPVIMQNGDLIIFYTRAYEIVDGTGDTTDHGNSLQVRINPTNDDLNVGQGLEVGDFTQGLITINAGLVPTSIFTPNPGAYPSQWTRFEVTVSGLSGRVKGRFAFRYFVTDAGANGNGTGIGIDSVAYKSVRH
ncbi:MAG: choice-of-anchor J domain-containing protein [Ginsengibacter sp.]